MKKIGIIIGCFFCVMLLGIFFINVPIGILTLYLTYIFLEDPPYAKKQSNVKMYNYNETINLLIGNNDNANIKYVCPYLSNLVAVTLCFFVPSVERVCKIRGNFVTCRFKKL